MTTRKNGALRDLLRQQEALQKQIDELRNQEKAEALETIRAMMADYGITTLEIEGRKRPFKPRGPRKAKLAAEAAS
ncbi:histone family protein nucleoid-structuring protein H-NS [Burkholderia pseudomallei]|nr:histone family protein nucleoid-structuring protein H-NS [Burkholderia pseudomallei]CAJ5368453.1 histone family protein nucleoid-structuring protein H-NS [Burkholderia pseudomallei]CAJ5618858.1 histone family protein nucleoid-structuring protein H-NS [Burkholderia pseudomallei]CAJ8941432.1 histone family protein nucleoid-structuring protein H-NS [Burkholderia pseudomallei]CAK0596808.1 histone family protein nucleoid-structuring protein H-NS [Burkholderia pseudomallei]